MLCADLLGGGVHFGFTADGQHLHRCGADDGLRGCLVGLLLNNFHIGILIIIRYSFASKALPNGRGLFFLMRIQIQIDDGHGIRDVDGAVVIHVCHIDVDTAGKAEHICPRGANVLGFSSYLKSESSTSFTLSLSIA